MLLLELKHEVNEAFGMELIGRTKALIKSLANIMPELKGLIDVATSDELPKMLDTLRALMDRRDELEQISHLMPTIEKISREISRFI